MPETPGAPARPSKNADPGDRLHSAVMETALPRSSPRPRSGTVVLLYHRLVEDHAYPGLPPPQSIFSLALSRFVQQLDYLDSAGYRALSLDEYEAIVTGRQAPPARGVLITFDDGCESVLRLAAPELARRRMPAVVFVTSDPAAGVFHQPHSQRRLTDFEMVALEKQAIRCESHGLSHAGLGDLSPDALRFELLESRRALSAVLGRQVSALALPLNSYDERVLAAARECGYTLVFTSNPGLSGPGDDPGALRRILVEGGGDLETFARSLTTPGQVQRRILAWVKRVPPLLIGYHRWMPLRRRIFASPIGRFLTPRALRLMIAFASFVLLLTILAAASRLLRGALRP